MKNMLLGLSVIAAISLTGCATTPSKPLTFDQLGRYSTTPSTATLTVSAFRPVPI